MAEGAQHQRLAAGGMLPNPFGGDARVAEDGEQPEFVQPGQADFAKRDSEEEVPQQERVARVLMTSKYKI